MIKFILIYIYLFINLFPMFKHYTWEHIELLWLSRWFWSYKLPISLQNNKTYECNAHNNDNDKNDKNNENFNNKNN